MKTKGILNVINFLSKKKKKTLTDRGVDLYIYNTFYLLPVFHTSQENNIHDVTCRETPVQIKKKSRLLKTKYKCTYLIHMLVF